METDIQESLIKAIESELIGLEFYEKEIVA